MKKTLCLLSLMGFIAFTSCKKDISSQKITVKAQTQDGQNYPFDNWETATGMPVSPTVPANNIPSMPWQSQSGTPIDAAIVSDFKKSDGWMMLYNTFNNSVLPYYNTMPTGGLYFALYNVYRGILRFYVYVPSGFMGNNENIEHGLSIYTANSSTSRMLNFDGLDLVDAGARVNAFTKTNNVGVAIGGGWYVMQYEIAYDPDFPATTYPNLGLSWNSRVVDITQILISGTQAGTITGSITQQSSGFNWSGALINGILAAAEIYGTAGASAFGTMGTNLTSAATGGLAGNIGGFFSAIFGGNSNNPQEVDLKMNTTISLNGTLSSGQPFIPNSLVPPGQTVANTIGAPLPLTDSRFPGLSLGAVNLLQRPTVDVKRTVTSGHPATIANTTTRYDFTLEPASFQSIVNPILSTNATVTIQRNILAIYNGYNSNNDDVYGPAEIIGNYSAYPVGSVILQGPRTLAIPQIGVRVTWIITPHDTSIPQIRLTKTFIANRVNL